MTETPSDAVLRAFAPHPYQSLDDEGWLLSVNDAWLDVLGYDRQDVEGARFTEFLTDESSERFDAAFAEFKATGSVAGVKLNLRHADGHAIPVTFDGRAEYDADGAFVRSHCQFTDISRVERQTAALDQSNTVLTTLLENLPVGVLVEDASREIIATNEAFCTIFGLSFEPEALIGQDCAQAAEQTKDRFVDSEGFVTRIEEILTAREPVFGEELRLTDGRTLARSYVPYSLPDGESNLWLYRDITELKDRERELERQLDLFEKAQDLANVGAWEYDVRKDQGWCTKEVSRIHGLPAGVVPSPEKSIQYYHPDDQPTIEDAFAAAIERGESYDLELRFVDADGEHKWVRTRGEPQYEDGKLVRVRGTIQDVTEHEEREQQLRRYRQAVESSTDMLTATDDDYAFIFANRQYRDFFGLDPDEDITSTRLPAVLRPEEFAEAKPYLDRALAGETLGYEMTRTNADGEKRVLDIQYYPLEADDGTIIGDVAAMRDVTDRKDRESQLRRYRQAIESSKDLLAAVDENLEYLFANERYCEYHGIDPESARGRPLRAVIGDEAFAAIEPGIQTALTGETYQTEVIRETPHLGERTLDVRLFPLTDDAEEILGVGASMRDVTVEKETQARYEALFNSIRDAIIVADTERQLVNCNPAFTDLFGYELADIEGKPSRYLYASDEEYERMGEAIRNHMGDRQFLDVIQFEKKSGQEFPGEANVFYLKDGNGTVVGFIGLIRDVSDREQRLRQLKIIDRVLQHNFHNDMNVIQGLAENIQAETTGKPASDAEMIVETGEKLLSTVAKERRITKFLSDPPQRKRLDLASTVRAAESRMKKRHPDTEIRLDLQTECDVTATPAIGQAIEELVENAIVHSDKTRPTVQVRVEKNREHALVEVTDDGPGVPEMERDVLTGEADIEPLYHGSGLGLWLVNLVVNQSGGSLAYEENDPCGSTTTIRLPFD